MISLIVGLFMFLFLAFAGGAAAGREGLGWALFWLILIVPVVWGGAAIQRSFGRYVNLEDQNGFMRFLARSTAVVATLFVAWLGIAFFVESLRATAVTEPPQPTPTATATPAPTPTPTPPPSPSPGGSPQTITIAMLPGYRFDTATLTAKAGRTLTVVAENRDTGVLHNIGIYTDVSATTKIAATSYCTAPCTEDVTFGPLSAGSYYFRCDAHLSMNGKLNVQ